MLNDVKDVTGFDNDGRYLPFFKYCPDTDCFNESSSISKNGISSTNVLSELASSFSVFQKMSRVKFNGTFVLTLAHTPMPRNSDVNMPNLT